MGSVHGLARAAFTVVGRRQQQRAVGGKGGERGKVQRGSTGARRPTAARARAGAIFHPPPSVASATPPPPPAAAAAPQRAPRWQPRAPTWTIPRTATRRRQTAADGRYARCCRHTQPPVVCQPAADSPAAGENAGGRGGEGTRGGVGPRGRAPLLPPPTLPHPRTLLSGARATRPPSLPPPSPRLVAAAGHPYQFCRRRAIMAASRPHPLADSASWPLRLPPPANTLAPARRCRRAAAGVWPCILPTAATPGNARRQEGRDGAQGRRDGGRQQTERRRGSTPLLRRCRRHPSSPSPPTHKCTPGAAKRRSSPSRDGQVSTRGGGGTRRPVRAPTLCSALPTLPTRQADGSLARPTPPPPPAPTPSPCPSTRARRAGEAAATLPKE